jgi:hypothetical protein
MCISSSEHIVTLNLGGDNLAHDILVGDADNDAVLGGVVLVLILADKLLASVVVSLTLCIYQFKVNISVFCFQTHTLDNPNKQYHRHDTSKNELALTSATAVFDLVSLEVLLALDDLEERLQITIREHPISTVSQLKRAALTILARGLSRRKLRENLR